MCLCIPLALPGNNLVKTFLQQQRIVGGVIFYMFHVLSNESMRLVLPRTSSQFSKFQHTKPSQPMLCVQMLVMMQLFWKCFVVWLSRITELGHLFYNKIYSKVFCKTFLHCCQPLLFSIFLVYCFHTDIWYLKSMLRKEQSAVQYYVICFYISAIISTSGVYFFGPHF
jgi:hypothetical protein